MAIGRIWAHDCCSPDHRGIARFKSDVSDAPLVLPVTGGG
jgi:hypothetical protein